MACVSKKAFNKPEKRKIEKIPLPECGEDEYVNAVELGAKDLLALQEEYGKGDTSNLQFVFDLLYRTLVGDDGINLFESAADVAENFNLAINVLERIAAAVLRLSGLDVAEKN